MQAAIHPPKLTVLFLAAALAAVSTSCGSKPKASSQLDVGDAIAAISDDGPFVIDLDKAPFGLAVRVREGKVSFDRASGTKPAPAAQLSEAHTKALFARLPAFAGQTGDKKDFAFRERSLPPPRTGDTIKTAFPPPGDAARPADGSGSGKALEVLRFAPEGDVPLAPHVSVTFSHPMVAVTSHADSVAAGVPVRLEPQPPGTWRWLGTRTLLFDPDVRMPMSTRYQVTIPAGTRSATGVAIDSAVSFEFTTPAPQVKHSHPTHGPHRLDPVFFVLFDQKIDPAAVLETIEIKAGNRTYGVRAASATEVEQDEAVKRLVERAEENEQGGRYVTFRAGRKLSTGTSYTVEVGPGTPSLEGPRKTESAQTSNFFTFHPLQVVRSHCNWSQQCRPHGPWMIEFNNPLDAEAFDAESLVIEPELAGLRASVSGTWLNIQGRSKARTTYRVSLPASLEDTFGQSLGKSQRIEFQVGDATPQFFGKSGLVLLDPAAKKPTFDIHTVNIDSLDVKVYRVEPSDWERFVRLMERNPRKPQPPPGRLVVDRRFKVATNADEMVETSLDLAPALGKSGLGHAVVIAEPTNWPHRYKPNVTAWVQSTRIGVDAFVDATDLLAWATRLADGRPMPGVRLEVVPHGVTGKSGADGTATLALPAQQGAKKGAHLLLARSGDDVAFLPEHMHWWSPEYGGWFRRDPGETLRWFVFDDRQMYRPGEKVSLKGWIRRVDNRKNGDVGALRGAATAVRYRVQGPRGNDLTKGTTTVNAAGGFHLDFELPKTPNLGSAAVILEATGPGGVGGTQHHHRFQIQEFRRPEFEVSSTASEGPHLVGGSADVTVKASYYAGGGLQNADVRWAVRSTPTSFVPPNRRDFTFGTWVPWWRHQHDPSQHGAGVETLEGTTDATGSHVVAVDFLSSKPPRPMSLVAEAWVTDVNRQTWSASSTLLVHPADLYVGLRRDRYFTERGKPIEFDVIVVDHDGKAVAGVPVQVAAVQLEWKYKGGQWTEEERNPQNCSIASATEPSRCRFETPDGGSYRITATLRDARGRPTETQLTHWVTGGKVPPVRNVEQEELTMIPDREDYKPGDTARILVQAPFAPAEGLLTVRRSGVVRTTRFKMDTTSTTLEVPIEERHVPNVHIQVDLVGSAPRVGDDGEANPKLPRRPAYALGRLELPVPPTGRTLAVKVAPEQSRIEPGGQTSLNVSVTDAAGKPVRGAELAVVVVDESVLALSGYQTPDPIPTFYARRGPDVADYHARRYATLSRPDEAALAGATGAPPPPVDRGDADDMPMAAAEAPQQELRRAEGAAMPRRARASSAVGGIAGGAAPAQPQPIAVRTNFDALALFAPEEKTGADGRARVSVKVPDNLTRYRIMVVAVAGNQNFGSGESNVTARMPLMVRPSPPRFLNFGDVFELPVVLQNQTDEAMTVHVAVRAENAAITDGLGRSVTVAANDRVEVRFPASAEMPGTARFQVGAAAGRFADASELALPVWTPATTEAFATYGEIDEGAIKQPVAMPAGVVEEFGGLEVTTSSTQLQALTDAFLYLVHYPYECAEQTASRVMAIAALRDILHAFESREMPSRPELESIVRRDVRHRQGLQNHDGGFAFWVRGHTSWPYISIHVAHALVRVKEKGYEVPDALLTRSQGYLKNIERHIPHWYPPQVKRTLIAYSLYVRKRMGDLDIPKARRVMAEAGLDGLSLDGVGWLYGAMTGSRDATSELTTIRRYLANKVSETAAAANFTTTYADGAYLVLHSSRRADGILLEALIDDQPKSDLIPKVTRGLLAHRKRGRWGNTQENSFVLLAMDKYFQTYEKVTPNFVARAWLGDQFAGEETFRGRETKHQHFDVPMSYLARAGVGRSQDLILEKRGKGRLYYRIGMTYAPRDLRLPPADHGFAVERVYEPVDDDADVRRMPDGSWKIRAGALVRVRLTMVAQNRRYHVALVDPLPAGLEPMNPALAVTGTVPADPNQQQRMGRYWWWSRTWYEHQNMRDERVEAFTSLLWAGVHEYSYVARATTPGRFVVPPTKAEEMYFPETFGRSSSDRVHIE